MYEPLFTFMTAEYPHNPPPSESKMPASCYGDTTPFELSVLAFAVSQPADSWPIRDEWMVHARDIYANGYEIHREAVEIRMVATHPVPGGNFGYGSVIPNKGFGRVTMLLFGILYTYQELWAKMSQEEQNDFRRWIRTASTVFAVYVHQDREEHFLFRRVQLSQQQAQRQQKNMLQTTMVFDSRAKSLQAAFLKAIEEYNMFGSAASNLKLQVDQASALRMYGLKVGLSAKVWAAVERHFHMFRVERSGSQVFDEKAIELARTRFLEGDYIDDLSTHLTASDTGFRPNATSMWMESLPQQSDKAAVDSALTAAEDKIAEFDTNRSSAAWQSDTLKLCRDASMCAKLLQSAESSERNQRLAKLTHLKEQNQIGAQVIFAYSQEHCRHIALCTPDADVQLNEFLTNLFGVNGAVIIWCDFMKLGRVNGKELDDYSTRLKKALGRKPAHTVGLVICPHLISEKVKSLRGEMRRIEDKFDAKGLDSFYISLRCEPPPLQKRVSLSEAQESAQLLAGQEMPRFILEALLHELPISSKVCGVVNFTPYDGHLEHVCAHWRADHGTGSFLLKSFSISPNVDAVTFSERVLLNELLKDCEGQTLLSRNILDDFSPTVQFKLQ
ncbi:unnamed protein product [Effrenium voratum]|uniref:Uncharacterized protein n=1 Tax=Effrenium voratum TaxID=2562239 RepID=A0AA36N021_9DINO|nr:unnamed protein product [Effrenium voratum]